MWRPAKENELSLFVDMCRELNREDPCTDPVPDSHMVGTFRALTEQPVRGKALALELGGKVAGYALLISFWSNELGGEVCTIDELYVRPEFRGQGHGTALVREIQHGGPAWPGRLAALELEVSPKNAKARALYESLGFKVKRNASMRFKT